MSHSIKRTCIRSLAVIAGEAGTPALDLVRSYWESQTKSVSFATQWRRALHDGFLSGTESPTVETKIREIELGANFGQLPEEDVIELQLRPDPMVGDGSKANNGWLQETPSPHHQTDMGQCRVSKPQNG